MRRLLPAVLGIALLVFMPALPVHADTTITPQIQLVAADSHLTYEHQATTVTGTVTYTAADGTTQPLAGQPVQIVCAATCTGVAATTDANGQFTVPVTADSTYMWVQAMIPATGTVAAATGIVYLDASSPARLTATATPSVFTSPSQTVTFSGVLQYQGDDGTWKPLPGRTISIAGAGASGTITTAADGTFTSALTLTIPATSVSQQVTVGWTPSTFVDDTFFTSQAATVTVTNPATATFSGFQATANADGTVTLSSGLTITPATQVTLNLQYSPNGTSGWKTFWGVTAKGGFSYTRPAPLPTAWYRAVAAPSADNFRSISPVLKAGRTVTRVTGFKVSATKVAVGHSFKITGSLQRDVKGTWKPLAKQQVWMMLKPSGTSTWYWYSKPVTSVSGAFSATIKVVSGMPSAAWLPVFNGATGYYASSPAKAIKVTVG